LIECSQHYCNTSGKEGDDQLGAWWADLSLSRLMIDLRLQLLLSWTSILLLVLFTKNVGSLAVTHLVAVVLAGSNESSPG